jgi:hypothetical protein
VKVEPAVKGAAAQAEPKAREFTEGTLKPGADAVAEHAVPATKAIGETPARSVAERSIALITSLYVKSA